VGSLLVSLAVILAFSALLWVLAPWIVDRYFDLKYGEDA
jgi:hypothetical protein